MLASAEHFRGEFEQDGIGRGIFAQHLAGERSQGEAFGDRGIESGNFHGTPPDERCCTNASTTIARCWFELKRCRRDPRNVLNPVAMLLERATAIVGDGCVGARGVGEIHGMTKKSCCMDERVVEEGVATLQVPREECVGG